MRIIINHLTRMQHGYVCAAGIDIESKAHIRPELPMLRLPATLTATYGGPFDIATEIDLGPVSDIGSAPEIEDRMFNVGSLKKVRDVPAPEFWQLLEGACSRDLRTIFGSALQATMSTYCLQEKTGIASLGCLVPKAVFDLRVVQDEHKGETKTRIRLQCDLGDGLCFPVVTTCVCMSRTRRRQERSWFEPSAPGSRAGPGSSSRLASQGPGAVSIVTGFR